MKTNLTIILLVALVGCNSKQPAVTNTYITNPITSGTTLTNGTTAGTNTAPSGCDGIARTNATQCYYKNIPTVQVSGGLPGQVYWSSLNLPAAISQNQFATDATFNVRIIARRADQLLSASGRTCSSFTANNSKKLKVQLMLRKQGVGLGEAITLTSDLDTPSAVAHFTPPAGTTQPYILEVVSVLADIRCNWAGGSSSLYCPYSDIPINTYNNNTAPTDCVAFDIQYSTDNTYDLP